jgi:hypothetical protein
MRSNALMYRDMSWGKLDWEETYVPAIYDSSALPADRSCTQVSANTEVDSVESALADGYR